MSAPINAANADLALLPLNALHQSLGARMAPFAGHSMPLQYAGIVAEHLWTRAHASLFDVSHMGQLLLAGPDVDRALEALLPGDISGLGEGVMRYSLLLNESGGILDDLIVTRRGDQLYLVVNGATKAADIVRLGEYLPASISIHASDDHALLALQGPEAVAVLDRLIPGVAALKFMRAGHFTLDHIPLWVSRSGYTGEDGFEISLSAADAAHFADILLNQDAVRPAGLGARDSLRLEAGLPLYGQDLDPTTSPVEAGLSFAIGKRRKIEGGFPGADRVLRELIDGPKRRRVGLRLNGRQPARHGAPILHDGRVIGTVTSGGFGPSCDAPIAMGYVESDLAHDGQALQIEVRTRLLEAHIVPLTQTPKKYVRPVLAEGKSS